MVKPHVSRNPTVLDRCRFRSETASKTCIDSPSRFPCWIHRDGGWGCPGRADPPVSDLLAWLPRQDFSRQSLRTKSPFWKMGRDRPGAPSSPCRPGSTNTSAGVMPVCGPPPGCSSRSSLLKPPFPQRPPLRRCGDRTDEVPRPPPPAAVTWRWPTPRR